MTPVAHLITHLAVGALVVAALGAGRPAPVASADSAAPPAPPVPVVVVELFTSEGCSSCPAADATLRELIETQPVAGVEVIGLGQHVDYWNRLGWRDPFSAPAFTARQRTYAEALGSGTYTPQAVVQGHAELVGSQRAKLLAAIEKAGRGPRATVTLARSGTDALAVRVTDLPAGTPATDVVLALTETDLATAVRRGENAGRTLRHAPVVRTLRTVGTPGADGTFGATVPLGVVAADWQPARLRAVVLVQERASRRIVGAASLPLAAAAH